MGGISTGIGLFSGVDTGSLISQLLAASSRPKQLAQQRVLQLQSQQAAFLDIRGRLTTLKTSAGKFNLLKVFETARAVSSNESALTATASAGATPGAYSFIVDRIVGTQQLLSRGFPDRATSSIGAERFIIEPHHGRLDRDVPLADLNGGQGVSRGKIIVTDSAGASVTVDLSRTGTVGEVLEAINTAGNGKFTARVNGDKFVITDAAGGTESLRVGNGAGYTTATSLGIEGTASVVGSGGAITGSNVYRLGGGTSLQSLNDGNGVRLNPAAGATTNDFSITTRDGSVLSFDIGNVYSATGTLTASAVASVQGVIDRINSHPDGKVTASIGPDGASLRIVDNTAGAGTLTITDVSGSGTATDLGIAGTSTDGTISGRRVLAGLNSTLIGNLRGGQGLADGAISITARDGTSFGFALPTGGSVSELIDAFNTETGGKVLASLDATGTGIRLTDTTGGGGNLVVSGAAAEALGLETDPAGVAESSLRSARLQHRYVTPSTLLATLNGGTPLGTGSFEITNAKGERATVNIGESVRSIGEVLSQINGANIGVTARVNDNGDGIIIEDTTEPAGGQKIKVRDVTGTIARSLNLAKEATGTGDDNFLDGSFERTIELSAADTLDKVIQKINDASAGVRATVINDGSGANPFRLSLTSTRAGSAGRFTIDMGELDLGLTTIGDGADARIFYGASDAARGVLLSSSSNIFDGVIGGVRIDAVGPSDTPVTITVSRDTEAVETAIKEFVDGFNDIISRMGTLTSYDAATQRRGTLLGDSTLQQLRGSLFSTLESRAQGVSGQFQFLSQVGVSIASGGRLELDTDELRQAMERDPQGVADLFAAKVVVPRPEGEEVDPNVPLPPPEYSSLGIAEQMVRLIDRYVNAADGVLRGRNETLDTQIRQQNQRVAAMDAKLANQRIILQRQFLAMEQAIGQLQSQQGAIAGITRMF